MRSTRVEGASIVAEMAITVNLTAPTIELVVAKMRTSHRTLIDLLLDSLRSAGAPPRALVGLEGLRAAAVRREPEWFNNAAHYREATNQALDAQTAAMATLASADVWEGEADPRMRMLASAELCARAGEPRHAASLLLLAQAHEATSTESTLRAVVEHVDAAAVERALINVAPDADRDDARRRLLAALPPLLGGVPSPWPAALVALCAGGDGGALLPLTGLVKPLVRPAFVEGARVIAWRKETQEWETHHGTRIVRVLPDGSGYDVSTRIRMWAGMAPHEVLVVSEGGVGALLREASAGGHETLVFGLLDLGVSPYETADATATTALHKAAAAGHAEICWMLLQRAERSFGFAYNKSNERPFDLAAQGRYVAARRVFIPSESDQAVPEALRQGGPLFSAADAGHVATLRTCEQDYGVSVLNAPTVNGVSLLMLASRRGHTHAVKALLEKGADPFATSQRGCTALHMAAEEGCVNVVELLLEGVEAKQHLVAARTRSGARALDLACENGHVDAARVLLKAKADITASRVDGHTPLTLACRGGFGRAVDMLLEARADVAVNHTMHVANGPCALWLASRQGDERCVRTLLRAGAPCDQQTTADDRLGETALMATAQRGHLSAMRVLLEHRAVVDVARADGATALIAACHFGQAGSARLLLDSRARTDIADENGWTALLWASQMGHTACVHALLQVGAAVNQVADGAETACVRRDFLTPLMCASRKGHESVARALLQARAQVNARRHPDGFTALILAARSGNDAVVRVLVKEDHVELNAVLPALSAGDAEGLKGQVEGDVQSKMGQAGYSALMCACRKALRTDSHCAAVRILLHAKAEVCIQGADGKSALMLACAAGDERVVRELLNAGAVVDAVATDGATALSLAQEAGHVGISSMLGEGRRTL